MSPQRWFVDNVNSQYQRHQLLDDRGTAMLRCARTKVAQEPYLTTFLVLLLSVYSPPWNLELAGGLTDHPELSHTAVLNSYLYCRSYPTTRIYKALGKTSTAANIHAPGTLHQPTTCNRGRTTSGSPSSTDAQSPLPTPPAACPRNHFPRKDFSKAEHDTVDER